MFKGEEISKQQAFIPSQVPQQRIRKQQKGTAESRVYSAQQERRNEQPGSKLSICKL